jgi:hypothetical protein
MIAGEFRKNSARDFECSIMTAIARRIGASFAPGGAGAGMKPRASGAFTELSAPGSTKPWATTNAASRTAKVSSTPDFARAIL